MKCADLEDRLFDEDCRAALLGRAPAPANIAAHLAACEVCHGAWQRASTETQELSRPFAARTPPRVRTTLLRAFRPATPGPAPWRDTDCWAWVIGCGALGAAIAGSLAMPSGHATWTGLELGLGLGCAVATLRGARLTRRAWGTTGGAVLRRALRLAQGN